MRTGVSQPLLKQSGGGLHVSLFKQTLRRGSPCLIPPCGGHQSHLSGQLGANRTYYRPGTGLEDSTAQKGDGQYIQYMSPGNLSYFSALGACPADTTRGALADRKTTEIPWPEPLEEESKEPTTGGWATN